jgi:hypothetical protein
MILQRNNGVKGRIIFCPKRASEYVIDRATKMRL